MASCRGHFCLICSLKQITGPVQIQGEERLYLFVAGVEHMFRERIQFTTYWFMFRIFISFLTYFDILYFLRDVCIFCKFSIWLVFLLFRWFFSWLFLSYCIFYLHFLLYTHPNFLPCLSFHFSLPPYCFLSLRSSVPEIFFILPFIDFCLILLFPSLLFLQVCSVPFYSNFIRWMLHSFIL